MQFYREIKTVDCYDQPDKIHSSMIQTFLRFTIQLFTFIILPSTILNAQTTTDITPGNFVDMAQDGQKMNIRADHAFAQVTIYSPNIIRIRFTSAAFEPDFSYAVAINEEKTEFTLNETAASIEIATDSLKLVIQKSPLLFSFYTKNNKLINADDFGTVFTGNEITTYKKLFPSERFIGLGEKGGNLDRRGNGYTNWNTDCFGYTENTDPLYISIPFYIGLHDSLCYGIYLDNSSRTNFNFGASNNRFSSFGVEHGEMDYYFIYHSNVEGIISSYTHLTGRMEMPPIWSLGFQQCRWSYYPDTEVLNIAKTFREKNIPLDVIYLDIDYMDQYKIFTWDKNRFPDPAGLLSELKSMGIHTTVIVDPGIKIEKGYHAYEEGVQKKLFATYPDGSFYAGEVWPGLCHFPDFTNPATRTWWGNSFSGYINAGVEGFWNDMNEPATWGQKFPSLVQFNFDGHGGSTLEARNIYGMQMARSTFEGTKNLLQNKRPFVLTRSGFAGIQKYSAVWTGDNTPSDDHLLLGVRLVNSLGISGVSFAGVDVGGFNADATAALYARWISLGAFTPFFRAHKAINYKEAEPWSYGEQTEEIAKKYISLRYRLLPYLYSAMYDSHQTGLPVNRTLAINYSYDAMIYNSKFQNEFLFGPSILVAPVKSSDMYAEVYFPQGGWYDIYNDKFYKHGTVIVASPLHRLPVFVKAGSIIPMQTLVQSTSEKVSDTLFLHLYTGEDNTFLYYEDDGITYDYGNGNYYLRNMEYTEDDHHLTISKTEGNYSSKFKYIKLFIHSDNGIPVHCMVNNERKSIQPETYSLMGKFILNYSNAETAVIGTIVVNNSNNEISISW